MIPFQKLRTILRPLISHDIVDYVCGKTVDHSFFVCLNWLDDTS